MASLLLALTRSNLPKFGDSQSRTFRSKMHSTATSCNHLRHPGQFRLPKFEISFSQPIPILSRCATTSCRNGFARDGFFTFLLVIEQSREVTMISHARKKQLPLEWFLYLPHRAIGQRAERISKVGSVISSHSFTRNSFATTQALAVPRQIQWYCRE